MLDKVLELLSPERGGIFVDGTLGGGGHSEGILRRFALSGADGRLFGIDRDADAIASAGERLGGFPAFTAVRGNFFNMRELLAPFGVTGADGILLDLGVSSHQLDDGSRGFSYMTDAKLDMRMDRRQSLSAYEVVNAYSEQKLFEIIRDYGEERFAKRIASAIVKARESAPIESTAELSDVIKSAIPAPARREGPHPAKRTFQAIRIEVNGELAGLEKAVTDCARFLNAGGVIAVITFHSLEDRIVKNVFKTLKDPCICPKSAPVCICGRKPELEIITAKPVVSEQDELDINPRARSAKLRAARRLPAEG